MTDLTSELFDSALCRKYDPELFFADNPGRAQSTDTVAAKAVCQHCPVRQECLDVALHGRILFGVWGGTNAQERARMLRRRRTCDALDGADDTPTFDGEAFGDLSGMISPARFEDQRDIDLIRR